MRWRTAGRQDCTVRATRRGLGWSVSLRRGAGGRRRHLRGRRAAAAAARRRLFIINFGPVTSDGRRISRCNLISVQCLLTLTKASFRNFWVSFKLILILLECFVFCVTTLSYLNFTT